MPAERISNNDSGPFHVRVAWGRDQPSIQVGVGGNVEERFSNLGRHDVNRLIQVLRRARDAAFGKDE